MYWSDINEIYMKFHEVHWTKASQEEEWTFSISQKVVDTSGDR